MSEKDIKTRIRDLSNVINHHRYLYHVLDKQKISDQSLDSLKHELKQLEEEYPDLVRPDSPSLRVGGKPLPEFKKITHKVRQWSFDDAFTEEEIKKWQDRNLNLLTKAKAPGKPEGPPSFSILFFLK